MNSALKKLPNSTLSAIAKLQAMLKDYECKPSTGMHYDVQSKYVTWRFPDKYKSIEILHITDVQLGHVECRLHRVREYIEWVLDRDNRFVLFGGDMIDSTTVLSPGSPWENLFEPQRQVYQFCEMFAPLRHRILGYVGGNHERRGVRTFGDLGVAIAMLLQVPYSGGRQLIDIYLGAHKPFTIDLWHGSGTARTDGAVVMMVSNYVKNHPGSHLYLTGHLHQCFLFPKHRETRLHGQNNVHISKYAFGMSSSFLSHWGTYAEVAGMSITDVMMLRCTLEANGKWEMSVR